MNIKKLFHASLALVGTLMVMAWQDGKEAVAEADRTYSHTYTIESGDTLWAISQHFGVTVENLAVKNDRKLSDTIYPGEVLRVPVFVPQQQALPHLSDWQYHVLAMVVQQEAGYDYTSALWVMTTILNRVDDHAYPNDIWSVITQPGQFEAYGAGHYLRHEGALSDTTIQAMMDAVNQSERVHPYTHFWEGDYADTQGKAGITVGGNRYFNW